MPNKKLGQHWLKDRLVLEAIADSAELHASDTVLEIGPGLGTLTSVLLRRVQEVIAVEYDAELARKLPAQFPGKNLTVVHADILTVDLSILPAEYKVVANVPYYITQKIVERLLFASNQPETMVLLVQKEVAEKLAAQAGDFTAIAVKLQRHYNVQLGTRVQKEYFSPPPKVDSQVLICKKIHVDKDVQNSFSLFSAVVDAGFSAPRKKLRTALSGGFHMSKDNVEVLCKTAGIDAENRAAAVGIEAWERLAEAYGRR